MPAKSYISSSSRKLAVNRTILLPVLWLKPEVLITDYLLACAFARETFRMESSSNYRPISLLSNLDKALQRLV